MRLTTLRVHGFKSFADVTEIHFHEGITTIVGPNGCGKSNISDAIRWVLGEQRPTAIRGAKMEEAIFQGSVNRRPVNRGSVHMTVSNEDNLLPVPFEEVEIGRTVYRDGGSDYAINRATVRLRDVLDLVRDTGLGANAYNVIENRMIDAILSDRAEERRALFEEASGIGKYKDRRKAATRRLERAEVDLQRLDDVIAEVETKVRSLARQKGKAERYMTLRARRLSVEITVVRHQLDTLEARMGQVEKALAGGAQEGEGRLAEVQAAESRVETLRIAQVDAERERAGSAGRLEEVRGELIRWERDLAVADERALYAERRLTQIGGEREEGVRQVEALKVESEQLDVDARAVGEELDGAREELERCQAVAGEVRSRLVTARDALDGVESRERDTARKGAQLEGDAAAAEAQAAELERRLERLQAELGAAADALTDMEAQGDLFSDRLAGLAAEVEQASAAVEAAQVDLADARGALARARVQELEAVDRSSALEAKCAALAEMARAGEGQQPAARAVLQAGLDGVLGSLIDFITAPAELAGAVERYLGPLALGIVVRDGVSAEGVRNWFVRDWGQGGGLVLLPLDRVPTGPRGGSLLGAVEVHGQGGAWAEALLGEADLVDGLDLTSGPAPGRALIGPGDVSMDRVGVVRLGNPSSVAGVLERRERLAVLAREAESASASAAAARAAREAAEATVAEAEAAVEVARSQLVAAQETRRKAGAEVAEQVDRKDRLDRHRDEMARQAEGTRASRGRALERSRESREDRQAILAEETSLQATRRDARETLARVQEEWESIRAEESRLTVLVTRLDGESSRLLERLERAAQARESALERVRALDEEETSLRDELRDVRTLKEVGAEATQALFARREVAEDDLRVRAGALEEVGAALREEENRARQARQAEREASDHLHQLELERQQLDGRIGRIRERLEGEWGRPLEALMKDAEPVEEESPEVLQEELREIVVALEKIGPVNMLAVEEHEEESQRLTFLREQHGDLVEARNDLRSAIKQINETATTLFSDTFERIRENFRSVHTRLFEGGEADIWLAEDEDPLESAIEIHASPRGKKTQRIDLLSGGERALTALSLLFAIYLVKPSPFCVLDEVDAPLDENNIGRFIRLLNEFKSQTQFIVITHNPRTIEAADWIYGVTMEEPGVSRIVGVRLEDALEQARGSAA